MTEGQRSLTDTCDELATAIRERDYFRSRKWDGVFLTGGDQNMRLRDARLTEGVFALCDECLERAVTKAKEALETALSTEKKEAGR